MVYISGISGEHGLIGVTQRHVFGRHGPWDGRVLAESAVVNEQGRETYFIKSRPNARLKRDRRVYRQSPAAFDYQTPMPPLATLATAQRSGCVCRCCKDGAVVADQSCKVKRTVHLVRPLLSPCRSSDVGDTGRRRFFRSARLRVGVPFFLLLALVGNKSRCAQRALCSRLA